MLTLFRLKVWLRLRKPADVVLPSGVQLTLRPWSFDQYKERFPLLVAATNSPQHALRVLEKCAAAATFAALSPHDAYLASIEAVKYIGAPEVMDRFRQMAAAVTEKQNG